MAKKAVKKSSRAGKAKFEDIPGDGISRKGMQTADRDFKDLLRDFATNPAVHYVVGGIATAVLAKIAANISGRYPELSNFIKENLDDVEGRLGDFKNNLGENARH